MTAEPDRADRHHARQWWYMDTAGKVTYSHDRDSLIAWRDGDHRRFGPGQDCYDLEDGDTLDSAFCVPGPTLDLATLAAERERCARVCDERAAEFAEMLDKFFAQNGPKNDTWLFGQQCAEQACSGDAHRIRALGASDEAVRRVREGAS